MSEDKHEVAATLMDGPARSTSRDEDEALPTIDRAHYKIDNELARGGMGRIFLARDRRLGRQVAVKEVLVTENTFLARFDREVRLTARLQHPGIVSIYEAGKWPSGEPFYAMRLIAGRPLETVIAETKTLSDRLALMPHVLAVAEALAYAHGQRIIHRDLKPANVLVGTFGETVVIDWGLAKDLDDTSSDGEASPYRDTGEQALTMLGSVMGTPSYMPLEQATGKHVDERADVYAIGAILYETLCGKPPYEGPTGMSILGKLLSETPPPLATRAPGVPADLLAIVERATARDAKDRYPTAKELADDLRRFQTGQLVASHVYTRWELARRWLRRYRTPVAIVTVAVVVLAGVGVASYVKVVAEKDRADAALDKATDAATRADAARAAEAKRADELTIVQARTAVKTDPTAAIAWLEQLSPDSALYPNASVIAADAEARGVAWLVPIDARVSAMVASADGKKLIAGDIAGGLWEIDVVTRTVRALGKAAGRVFELDLSDDATRAIVVAQKTTELWSLELWSLSDGKHTNLATTITPSVVTPSVAISGDGARVAYQTSPHDVAVCPSEGGSCVHAATSTARYGVKLVGDGRTLVVAEAGEKGRVVTFDATVDPAVQRNVYATNSDHILDATLTASADHQTFAFVGPDGKSQVVANKLARVGGSCRFQVDAIAPDGRWVACNDGKTLAMFGSDGKPGPAITLGDRVSATALGPSGIVAAGAADGELRIARPGTTWQWSLAGHSGRIDTLRFLDGGKRLSSRGVDGVIRIWQIDSHTRDVSTGVALTGLVTNNARISPTGVVVYTQEQDLHAIFADGRTASVTPPGRPFLLELSDDGSVAVYTQMGADLGHNTFYAWMPRSGETVTLVGENRDRGFLIVTGLTGDRIALQRDGHPVVTDLRTGAIVWAPKVDPKTEHVTFSSDLATALVTSDKRTSLRIVTASTERSIDLGIEPSSLSLSRDARWLGVVGQGAHSFVAIRVCDLTSGSCRDGGQSDSIMARGVMAASGRRFVTEDGQTLRVFDVATGKTEIITRSHEISQLAVAADGDTVAGLDEIEGYLGSRTFVRDLPTGEERTLPFDVPPGAIVFPEGGRSVRVLIEKGGVDDAPILYDSRDFMPRDASLKGVLRHLTNAVVDGNGRVTGPKREH